MPVEPTAPVNRFEILLTGAEGKDTEAEGFWTWARQTSYEFLSEASGELFALSTAQFQFPNDQGSEWRVGTTVQAVSPEVLSLANDAWRWCGGTADPDLARAAISTARVEYTRALLSHALWVAARMPVYRKHGIDSVLRWRSQFEVLGQLSPESLFLEPYVPPFEWSESRAYQLSDWTHNARDRELQLLLYPPALAVKDRLSREAVMAAAALAWVDGAIAATDTAKKLDLMACAGSALYQCGFGGGWEGHAEMLRSDAAHAGKRGARAKYQRTDQLKEWARGQVSPQMPRSMETARMLARRIPEHLREVSKDPIRLIYEALRNNDGKPTTDGTQP